MRYAEAVGLYEYIGLVVTPFEEQSYIHSVLRPSQRMGGIG